MPGRMVTKEVAQNDVDWARCQQEVVSEQVNEPAFRTRVIDKLNAACAEQGNMAVVRLPEQLRLHGHCIMTEHHWSKEELERYLNSEARVVPCDLTAEKVRTKTHYYMWIFDGRHATNGLPDMPRADIPVSNSGTGGDGMKLCVFDMDGADGIALLPLMWLDPVTTSFETRKLVLNGVWGGKAVPEFYIKNQVRGLGQELYMFNNLDLARRVKVMLEGLEVLSEDGRKAMWQRFKDSSRDQSVIDVIESELTALGLAHRVQKDAAAFLSAVEED
ncbi:hypothetical protein LTR17_017806 [Elasticomyces elasticus]|nr:hypothetical protein LTR17_017806 [Elasticomyces elasticus]